MLLTLVERPLVVPIEGHGAGFWAEVGIFYQVKEVFNYSYFIEFFFLNEG